MTLLLPGLLFLIFAAAIACLYTEGMWGNGVRLINVVTSALLAVNFFEPTADWLEGMMDTYTYMCDFLALWLVFGICMIVFRLITDRLSRVKVRFLKIADQIGSAFFACWIGWVMVCFSLMSLHTAPLSKNFMGGAFQPENRMIMSLAPDRQWLGFVQKVSLGAFSRSGEEEQYAFDPNGEFMLKYNTRRTKIENHVRDTGKIRVNPK